MSVPTLTDYTFSATFTGICLGPDGNLWASDSGGYVWKITPAGVGVKYATTTLGEAICSDGTNLWVAGTGSAGLAKVTTAGVVTNYAVTGGYGNGICLGPDGNLWVAAGNHVSKISTSGVTLNTWTGGGFSTQMGPICAGPDGNLWAADGGNCAVWQITTSGTKTMFTVSGPSNPLTGITAGTDGNIWIADSSSAVIKVSTSGVVLATYAGIGGPAFSAIVSTPTCLLLADANWAIWSLSTSGSWRKFSVAVSSLVGICADANGNPWAVNATTVVAGSLTGSALPALQYLVAFQDGPMDDPATFASPSGYGLGASGVWTDITPYVRSHTLNRGRQHELSMFEAGTLQLELGNTDGRFNPWNTLGPYFGYLQPRKLVKVSAFVGWAPAYNRFTGHIDSLPTKWDDPMSSFAQLHATDAFRIFNIADITPAYERVILNDGPTDYWRMNDLAGSSICANSSPYNQPSNVPGELVPGGAPDINFGSTGSLPADSSSTCVAIDGGGFIVSNLYSAFGYGQWAFECWVKYPNSGFTTDYNGASFVFKDGSNTVEIGIGPQTATGYGVVGALCRFINGATTTDVFSGPGVSNGPATDGGWHHYVFAYASSALTAYVDGVQVNTSAAGTTFNAPTVFSLSPTLAPAPGAFISGLAATLTQLFVQDVALYTQGLSAAKILKHFNIGAFPQASTDTRIGAVLDSFGWSPGARNLDAGVSTVQAVTSSLNGSTALSHLEDCECTEGGALFMDAGGKVRFISRGTLFSSAPYQVPQAIFGDTIATQIPFQPGPTLTSDDLNLYNIATGQRKGGVAQSIEDYTSSANYGPQTWNPPANLIGISDQEVAARLQYVVNQYAKPTERFQTLIVNLIDLIAPNLCGQVLALELMEMIEIQRAGIPGSTFTQYGLVERISEVVDANSWQITFGTDVADTGQYFEWGVSQWGQTTTWAY